LTAPNVPNLAEIGYLANEERFIARHPAGGGRDGRIEEIGRQFFEEVVKMHFSS
jgi:hypothetical protein